jgi:Tol biopolymer transport system component
MTNDRRQLIDSLVQAARERSPADRETFLQAACASDPSLHDEVVSLLTTTRASSFEHGVEGVKSPQHDPSLTGRRLGPYIVGPLLGAGGMGEVYRGRDTKLGRDVAIKILPHALTSDSDRLTRLTREARILASLNHPNIATIYGLEESSGTQALVMEFVDGEILRGPLPLAHALDCARQVVDALDAAHQQGIVHRDLKPANVKITSRGRVKVLDFGLATVGDLEAFADSPRNATIALTDPRARNMVGTPGYMSPEQATGRKTDKRADIWAFGCLLYELLTGTAAFPGSTADDRLAAIVDREPDWTRLPRSLPSPVVTLLRRCLEKAPDRRLDNIATAGAILDRARFSRRRWHGMTAAAALLASVAVGSVWWLRAPARPSDRSQWIQLTNFADSASQPALSPDGRMLAFVRGPMTFMGPGQIYVKALPNGEAVQLTNDDLGKMSPVFSPDGTRIAYGTRDRQFRWDTWVIAVPGNTAQPWLRNASGLTWIGPHTLLFSEMKTGLHMGLVVADENRGHSRDIYLPENDRAMAHRSYISPDGQSVLLVEMTKDGLWGPCRLVSMNGGAPARDVGPRDGGCTFGAWSHDGRWVYLTSTAGGLHHIWRQRVPDGQPEQVTSGPTEEEGIAVAPDGRSLVTAMALQTGSIWVHDADGERQISVEGAGVLPRFSRDGRIIACLVQKTPQFAGSLREPGDVWVADVKSGHARQVAAGVKALNFDLSADGQTIALEVVDQNGKAGIWLASVNGDSPLRQIPGVEGREPVFGAQGEVFFRRAEGQSGFVYRVHQDGTGLRKAIDRPVYILEALSPDEQWIEGVGPLSNAGATAANLVFPLDNGPPVSLGAFSGVRWIGDGHVLAVSGVENRTYVVPISTRDSFLKVLSTLRETGPAALERASGVRRIDAAVSAVGPTPEVYAVYRGTVQRNIYRIPLS